MSLQRARDTSRWNVPKLCFQSVEAVPSIEGEALVTVPTAGAPLDALVDFAGSDITFVSFHAAVSKARFALPYFTGWTLTPGRANRVALSDPGLSEEVLLAWFAGTRRVPATQIGDFIATLVERSAAKHVVLFGASGGGFAALNYARLFPGSTAVPVNPQTNILRFHRGMWTPYGRHAWGAPDDESAEEAIRRNVEYDITTIYAETRPDVDIVYMQNDSDQHHVSRHFEPFIAANPDARLRHVGGDWGRGHKPAPRNVLREVLGEVFADVRRRPTH